MIRYLLFISLSVFVCNSVMAQCPGCITNMACTSNPAEPTICPDTLPDGYAMQYYEEDLSFYLPAQFTDQGSGMTVTLNELHVNGVSGMPYGLQFQSSASSNIFYPSSNPPASEYGCARFCGTPLIPGDYLITVYVTAHVTVLGLNQTQDDAFNIPITIRPNPSGNAGFTIASPVGCSPHSTDFTANYASNGNPDYSYDWDFGNGNQSSSEFPPLQSYPAAGTYMVTLNTRIDTLDYTLSAVTVVNSSCDDPFDGPDYYIKIFEAGTEIFNNSGSHASNSTPASFSFTPIVLDNLTYTIEVWDNDDFMGGGQTGDDDCGQVTFNGHTPGAYTLIDGTLTVSFSVDHAVLNFNDTDTVVVYPAPVISDFSAWPNDTLCGSDTIQLSVSGGDSWQWYYNGSGIAGAIDSTYQPLIDGAYHVAVSNTFGCQVLSGTIETHYLPAPPYPTFYPSGNTLVTMLTGYAMQWYLDYSPISGATSNSVAITQTGYYQLEITNGYGCTAISNPFYAVAQSIGEFEIAALGVWPNPARNELFVDPAPQGSAWMISDLSGRLLLSGMLEQNAIELNDLAPGMYLIQVISPERRFAAKFVKE